jgi:hypothetical protein
MVNLHAERDFSGTNTHVQCATYDSSQPSFDGWYAHRPTPAFATRMSSRSCRFSNSSTNADTDAKLAASSNITSAPSYPVSFASSTRVLFSSLSLREHEGRTFDGRLALVLAPARDYELSRAHTRKVFRRLKPEPSVRAGDDDDASGQVDLLDGRQGLALDTNEAWKGERGHGQQQMMRAVGDGDSMSTSTVHEHLIL